MTKEEHSQRILELSDSHKYLMLKLPTSYGKTKLALDIIKRHTNPSMFGTSVLIAVPKLVIIETWKDEIAKWGIPDWINITFTTYISFPKHAGSWDFVILDEGHHFTENCAEASESYHADRVIVLSATIEREIRYRLKECFPGIYEYAITVKEAIDEGVLPDPKVILIPMMLDNTRITQQIEKNKSKSGQPIIVGYRNRFSVRGIKNRPVIIKCTQQEYYNEISEEIDWWEKEYMRTQQEFRKLQMLKKRGDRLHWLSELKDSVVSLIMQAIGDDIRAIIFCASIAQTERLGEHCINSKNPNSDVYFDKFNKGEIQHITACTILDEGINPVNCQMGIYANLSSSKIKETQRLGRILRHKNPVIIIPYFVQTREEEIVTKMLKNYNVSLIHKLFKTQVTKESIMKIINGTPTNRTEKTDN